MKKIHYTDRYLLNPYHPVTVFVIGAGGTGSQVATGLARISVALQALGHPGLHVTVFDPDTVTEANIGRQLFSGSELGLNKAAALVTRINRFFGFSWEAKGQRYPLKASADREEPALANIIVTCTDNIRSRMNLWRFLKKHREHTSNNERSPIYWMDFGNARTTGQVLIGNIRGKILQPVSNEYLPVPRMNVITKEVPTPPSKKRIRGRAARWRKPCRSRTFSSIPYWHKPAATSCGVCSGTEGHSTGEPISISIHYG